jgi:Mitochondrial inner membrane protein
MAAPFGDRDSEDDQAGKRPVPTIEGTAEEISVEPGPAAAAGGFPESEPQTAPQGATPDHAEPAENDSPRPPQEPPPNTDPVQLVSFFTHLAAGFSGGLIGVVLLALAWHLVPGLRGGSAAEITQLKSQLAALEHAKSVSPDALDALQDRVAKLEDTLKAMAAQAKGGGSVADAAAFGQQIDAAEKRLNADIDRRLAALKTASPQDLQALRQELEALKAKLAGLAQAQSALAQSAQAQSAKAGQSGADRQALDQLDQRVAKLESVLPELSSSVAATDRQARTATAAASLTALRAAAESGAPYETELTAFAALAPKGTDLGPLADHAKQGLPTMAALKTGFAQSADKALSSAVTPASGSFLGTLLSSASTLVTVKKLNGKGEASGAGAILDRTRDDLDRGDLPASVAETQKLTGPAKQAMAGWLSLAGARLAADAALKRLTAGEAAAESPPQTGP